MSGLARHQFQIAPPDSSTGVCAIGGSALPPFSRSRAATIIDDQKEMHRGLGARHNRAGAARCDASFPAHRQGRVHVGSAGPSVRLSLHLTLVPDTQTTTLAGRFGVRSSFRAFAGIEAGTSHLVATLIRNTADHSLHNAVEPFKRHLSAPVRYVPERSHGASHCAEQTSQGRGNV